MLKVVVLGGLAVACGGSSRQPASTPSKYPNLTRAQLEERLAATEARLAELLPVEERFDLAQRSSENEARVKPFLDKVFKVDDKTQKPPYVVECHARICKLNVDASYGHDWMGPLQSDADGMGMFVSMSFGRSTYMELYEPARAAGNQAAVKVAMGLYENATVAAAVADCKKQHPTPGTVTFTLEIDTRSHRFVAKASGSLADQPLGLCVRRIVDHAVASVALPPDATSGTSIPFTVQVP